MPRKRARIDNLQLCVRLDKTSLAMLNELAPVSISSYFRQLVAMDYGRRLERRDIAKREAQRKADRAER
jgi:hypothetical protein